MRSDDLNMFQTEFFLKMLGQGQKGIAQFKKNGVV